MADDTEEFFEKVEEEALDDTEENFIENKFKTVVCDGYSLEFDDTLKELLGYVRTGKMNIFYVDCFKGLSRNFEKFLHVLQLVLQSGEPFVISS